ncbi:Flp family type IVb pilin [Sphingomonas sp. MMS12-HWE2-04]|uniref:Flp family type IVb pilin n=1 Tax=Sphingomonas sp. MMS12-HWE2-04 TaxID=3234199 RepID=UPI00384A489A
MRVPIRHLRALIDDQRGATAVEYGLIVALIVIAMFASLQSVGTVTAKMWNDVSKKVEEAK